MADLQKNVKLVANTDELFDELLRLKQKAGELGQEFQEKVGGPSQAANIADQFASGQQQLPSLSGISRDKEIADSLKEAAKDVAEIWKRQAEENRQASSDQQKQDVAQQKQEVASINQVQREAMMSSGDTTGGSGRMMDYTGDPYNMGSNVAGDLTHGNFMRSRVLSGSAQWAGSRLARSGLVGGAALTTAGLTIGAILGIINRTANVESSEGDLETFLGRSLEFSGEENVLEGDERKKYLNLGESYSKALKKLTPIGKSLGFAYGGTGWGDDDTNTKSYVRNLMDLYSFSRQANIPIDAITNASNLSEYQEASMYGQETVHDTMYGRWIGTSTRSSPAKGLADVIRDGIGVTDNQKRGDYWRMYGDLGNLASRLPTVPSPERISALVGFGKNFLGRPVGDDPSRNIDALSRMDQAMQGGGNEVQQAYMLSQIDRLDPNASPVEREILLEQGIFAHAGGKSLLLERLRSATEKGMGKEEAAYNLMALGLTPSEAVSVYETFGETEKGEREAAEAALVRGDLSKFKKMFPSTASRPITTDPDSDSQKESSSEMDKTIAKFEEWVTKLVNHLIKISEAFDAMGESLERFNRQMKGFFKRLFSFGGGGDGEPKNP